jgi:hypothetical protein
MLVLARLLKALMAVLVVPVAVGLLIGTIGQLERITLSGGTFLYWVTWGFSVYLALHLLLYRPVPLFRISHRITSTIAIWLFGGQVASVEHGGGKGGGKGKGMPAPEGSTLVAFSPYAVPVYLVLFCLAGFLARRFVDRLYVDAPVSALAGAAIAFHWVMTADDLQQQRERWHIETYLLALGLVFVLTILVSAACLPWAVPEFSFVRALADGLTRAGEMYRTSFEQLFLY